jgi:hypothetical protein
VLLPTDIALLPGVYYLMAEGFMPLCTGSGYLKSVPHIAENYFFAIIDGCYIKDYPPNKQQILGGIVGIDIAYKASDVDLGFVDEQLDTHILIPRTNYMYHDGKELHKIVWDGKQEIRGIYN